MLLMVTEGTKKETVKKWVRIIALINLSRFSETFVQIRRIIALINLSRFSETFVQIRTYVYWKCFS